MIVQREKACLLIVDMQERLLPAMHGGADVVTRCGILLQIAAALEIPTVISEQYPKGLGRTLPELMAINSNVKVFEKTHFSCAGDPTLRSHFNEVQKTGRTQLLIAGIEAHVCVTQSVLGFRQMGFDCYVVADAVTSRTASSVDIALARLRTHFVSIINVEMALFEMLKVAGTEEFKTLTRLIR